MFRRNKVVELISVVVPIYKVEKYLNRCIHSLLAQTYRNLEIILVDDGSPDKSGDMCDDFATQDDRIVVIHKQNGGLSDARNTGIEAASGEYLFFLDSDDAIHEETLEILWNNLKETEADISVCDYLAYFEGNAIDTMLPRQNRHYFSNTEALQKIFDPTYGVQMVICTNKLYKKNLWDNIRFPVGKIHEDEFTTYKLIHKAQSIVYTDLQLYYYLQRSDSITGAGKITRKHFQVLDAFAERTSFFEAEGLGDLAVLSNQQSLNHMIIAYYKALVDPDREADVLSSLKATFDASYRSARNRLAMSTKDRLKNGLFFISPTLFQAIHRFMTK